MKKREDIVTIRALAIMLVAFGHSIILYSSAWNLYETSVQAPILDHLKNVINMLQMPLFFSVSGFCLVFTLLKGGVSGLDARSFLWNKCKRILLPFLAVGFLWLLPIRLLLDYPGYRNQSIVKVIVKDLLWGSDNGHLWFLPTLFLMLAVSLILIKICGTGIRLDIAMGVLGALALAVFGFAHTLVAWNTYLLQFTNYYFFFAMGFIYHRHEQLLYRQTGHATKRIVPAPVTAIILLACIVLSWNGHPAPIALALSAISVLAVYMLTPKRSCAPLRLISKDSMGIYLFHSPMLYISFTYWPGINPLLMILINFIGFGTIAILLTELMRRIHCGFIIGE